MLIKSTLIALIALGAISLTACDSDTKDSANKTVEKTKEAAQAAGETVQNASQEVVKETKDAAQATGETVDKAATATVDATKEAADKVKAATSE
jgi:hypothetical protein